MKYSPIVGIKTGYFDAHLCGSGKPKGKFFLIKFRKWDKKGEIEGTVNCCSISRDGTIEWYKYPEQSETYKDKRGHLCAIDGGLVMYMGLVMKELERLFDICLAELKYIYE